MIMSKIKDRVNFTFSEVRNRACENENIIEVEELQKEINKLKYKIKILEEFNSITVEEIPFIYSILEEITCIEK